MLPEKRKAIILHSHCFTCGKDLKSIRALGDYFYQQNIGFFSFDNTGLGESAGDFAKTTFSSQVEDIVSAYQYLKSQNLSPHYLLGHSLGGAANFVAQQSMENLKGLITLGTPSQPQHLLKHFLKHKQKIKTDGVAMVDIIGRDFPITQKFIDDISAYDITTDIKAFRGELLVLHSNTDELVNIEEGYKIFNLAKANKSFYTLNNMDHLILRPLSNVNKVGKVIGQWLDSHHSIDN